MVAYRPWERLGQVLGIYVADHPQRQAEFVDDCLPDVIGVHSLVAEVGLATSIRALSSVCDARMFAHGYQSNHCPPLGPAEPSDAGSEQSDCFTR